MFFVKWFQIASNTSKWVPKHCLDPKTSFRSLHASYGHTKKFSKKIDFGTWNFIFQVSRPSTLYCKNAFLSKIRSPQISRDMFNLLPFKVGCESFGYIGNLIWQIGEKEIFLIDLQLFWFTMKIYNFNFSIFRFYICKSWNCCPLLPYKGCMKQLDIIKKLVWYMNEKEYTCIHFQMTWFALRSHLDDFQMSHFLS